MFHGTFEQRIDEKGRLNVPVRFREVLTELGDDRLYLTNFRVGDGRCLEARPHSEWQRLVARLGERTDLSAAAQDFYDSYFLPGTHECAVDKQGRILVPPTLRTYAALQRDVMCASGRGKFRIWDKAKWESIHLAGEQRLVNEPNVLTELGL
jgi:MraZ protein